ncbi:hypothetical protein EDD18DRAFT_1125861 [Armillaria luteobubalina]|uniref:RRM domain-containing protein n=1 Tax=Armillaria luteobubalina TaxID=153913 RepID=A0AA39QLQ3_9AGAR|nr:hypothetical protein EDD18DRAFT_1125861 [Armillaria luteobubalina]
MDDAWQSQDIAPAQPAINIPSNDVNMTNGTGSGDDYPTERSGNAPRRSRSRSPGRGRSDGGQNPGNNLHVSGLSLKVDMRELETAFAKIGRVKKASVMYDPHTRESRGFGFVTMETSEEADAAITALNGTELMGKTLAIEKARRGRARTPTPGKYYGPGKRGGDRGGYTADRPYDPRPYDSRYARDYDYDRRDRRGRYDDYRRDYDRDRYDRDRYGGRDRDRDYDRDRGRYDDRRY